MSIETEPVGPPCSRRLAGNTSPANLGLVQTSIGANGSETSLTRRIETAEGSTPAAAETAISREASVDDSCAAVPLNNES